MGSRRLSWVLFLALVCGCASSAPHAASAPSRDPGTESVSSHQLELLHGLQAHGALSGKRFRGFHAYSPGCLRGTLRVLPGLPADERFGVFKEERSYPAWIRFSTAGNHLTPENFPNF